MRWRTHGGRLGALSEPVDALGPGEVLVQIAGCLFSPADLRALAKDGVCPGRAASGTVVAATDELADWLGVDVLIPEVLPCGQCDLCQRGRAPACPHALHPGVDSDGGLATHEKVPTRYLLRLDGPLALPEDRALWQMAVLAGPGARIWHALCRVGLGPGELALFLGETPESQLGARLAQAKAARALIVSPRQAEAASIKELLGDDPPRVWHLLETTGTAAGLAAALGLIRTAGTLCLIGEGDEVRLERALLQETAVLFTTEGHPDLLVELVGLVYRGELGLESLATRFGPETLPEIVHGSMEGPQPRCMVFSPGDLSPQGV